MTSTYAKLNIFNSKNYFFKKIIIHKNDELKIKKILDPKNNIKLIYYDIVEKEIKKNVNINIIKLYKKSILFRINNIDFYYKLKDSYIPMNYIYSFIIAFLICIEIGISFKQIKYKIENFDGITGRMSIKKRNENIYIDNSNSGTNKVNTCNAIEYAIKNYKQYSIILLIGEEKKEICEGFDPVNILKIINTYSYKIKNIIFIGKRLYNAYYMNYKNDKKIYFYSSINEGKEKIRELSILNKNQVFIFCLKCFR